MRREAIAPLFVLSARARDALATATARGGWRAIAARRQDAAERRFVASGAAVGVVDLRGDAAAGLEGLRLLADAAVAHGAVLVALLGAGDRALLGAVLDAGAGLYLAEPFDEAELLQTLRFADRIAARLAHGRPRDAARRGLRAADPEGWTLHAGGARVTLSPPLAARLALPEDVPTETVLAVFDALGEGVGAAALAAVRRVREDGGVASFGYRGPAGERIIHHLRPGTGAGTVDGSVETLDDEPLETGAPRIRDPLTGLDDAAGAQDWIAARLAAGEGCTALLLAVMRFDIINAAFGRAAGDALLMGVARRISRLAAGTGERIVARLVGAEFLIALAASAGTEEATFLAARLGEAIARPFVSGETVVTLSCRIGVAAAAPSERDAAALLRRAGAALAEAKLGDGAVRVLDAKDQTAAARDSALAVDLRRALDAGEIAMLFQPQVDVTSRRIVGVEALARWRHPRFGELGAAALFAAAARSDYLLELSDHVQRRAIAAAAAWEPALAGCRLAVNVTAEDMARPGFAARFGGLVDAAGLDRRAVTVEVTETSLIEDLGRAAELLAALRGSGFRVALDDFGTGYSSLAYLKALPLDYLKIDKRLSDDIAGSARDRVVVRGVIEMARSLGLAVIAEGVESEGQLALLAAEGCNYYQGFLCAPPLAADALARLVAETNR